MNLLILAGFVVGCVGSLWIAQTIALWAVGHRPIFAWPFRHSCESNVVRYSMKAVLHLGLLTTLFGYPAVLGENPLTYHWQRLNPTHWGSVVAGLAVTVALLLVVFAIGKLGGWIHWSVRHKPARLAVKITKGFLTPLPLTLVEEALFRGLLLEQLLHACPATRMGHATAVLIGGAFFSSMHFIRPQKRALLPALGLFAVGTLLGLAYIQAGHTYLLPMAIHAGGVLVIQVTRPISEYRGPAWLIGYSSYPICGAMGLTAMALIGILVATGVVA